MRRFLETLSLSIPIYVTRKNADGLIATWSLNAWVGVAITLLFAFNALVWGVVGAIHAVNAL